MEPKVLVSACLLGERCRYDGQTKFDPSIMERFKDKEIIPFCPEAPLFGTPRPRINLVDEHGKIAVIRESDGEDVTDVLQKQTKTLVDSLVGIEWIVLKSKSPSCGLDTTPIKDMQTGVSYLGDGLSAKYLKSHFPQALFFDEEGIKNQS